MQFIRIFVVGLLLAASSLWTATLHLFPLPQHSIAPSSEGTRTLPEVSPQPISATRIASIAVVQNAPATSTVCTVAVPCSYSALDQQIRRLYYIDGVPTNYAVISNQLFFVVATSTGLDLVNTNMDRYDAYGVVDPRSFIALSASSNPIFFKDKNNVYISGQTGFSILPGADPTSFEVVLDDTGSTTNYGVDAADVFDGATGQVIPNADPRTFQDASIGGMFTQDDNHVWCNYTGYSDAPMSGADGRTFATYVSNSGPSEYGHDGSTVFCCGGGNNGMNYGPLPGADYSTFTVDGPNTAHDKDHTYIACTTSEQ